MIDVTSYTDEELKTYILEQLPSMFNQLDGSNNQAILNIIADTLLSSVKDLVTIYQVRDLDKAEGKELDDIAADWGVSRIDADDEFLRFLIRLAKVKSRIGVTENDLIHLISYTLGANPSEFVVETRLEKINEVEAIKIANIPNKYHDSSRKTGLLAKYISECVAAEVRILEIQYSTYINQKIYVGTFMQRQRKKYSSAIRSRQIELNHHIYFGITANRYRVRFCNVEEKKGD